MVIKNERLPCQNSENPSSTTDIASKVFDIAAKANEEISEEVEVVVKVEKEDQKDDEKSFGTFEEQDIITEEDEPNEETLSQDTLVHDVVAVSVSISNSEEPSDQQSNSAEESSSKQLQNNNNSLTDPWVYYYPSSYDSYYITNTYDIEQPGEELPPGGAVAATSIMASAAIEHAGSVAEPPQLIGTGEPIFTSSDLPLQPYATPTSHVPPLGPPTAPFPPSNDLFVNPAFAHMSFLSDGSMVGPNGEIYSPAEYFPSVMDEHSQVVPAVIPVSPQPGDYPPGHPAAGGHDAATPPPSTNIGKLLTLAHLGIA